MHLQSLYGSGIWRNKLEVSDVMVILRRIVFLFICFFIVVTSVPVAVDGYNSYIRYYPVQTFASPDGFYKVVVKQKGAQSLLHCPTVVVELLISETNEKIQRRSMPIYGHDYQTAEWRVDWNEGNATLMYEGMERVDNIEISLNYSEE